MLEFVGHTVIRENHVGDWGTPFGMLIEHLLDIGEADAAAGLSVGDLDGFYKQARAKFDVDEAFEVRARNRVVLLQGGDPETLRLWKLLVDLSMRHFNQLYRKLGVLLDRRRPGRREHVQRACCPRSSNGCGRQDCCSRATGPTSSSRPATPIATGIRCL